MQRDKGGAPQKDAAEGDEATRYAGYIRSGLLLVFGGATLKTIFTKAEFKKDPELRYVQDPYQWAANHLSRLKRGLRTSHSVQRQLHRVIIGHRGTLDLRERCGRFKSLTAAEQSDARDKFDHWALKLATDFPALMDRSGKPAPAFIMPEAIEPLASAIAASAIERGAGRRNHSRIKRAAAAYLLTHMRTMASEFASNARRQHDKVLNPKTMNGYDLGDVLFALLERTVRSDPRL